MYRAKVQTVMLINDKVDDRHRREFRKGAKGFNLHLKSCSRTPAETPDMMNTLCSIYWSRTHFCFQSQLEMIRHPIRRFKDTDITKADVPFILSAFLVSSISLCEWHQTTSTINKQTKINKSSGLETTMSQQAVMSSPVQSKFHLIWSVSLPVF